MDTERWLRQQLDLLHMKTQLAKFGDDQKLPPKMRRMLDKFDVNEVSSSGHSLISALINYTADDPIKQVQDMNLLLRAGANVNVADSKQQRTPLMLACMQRNDPITRLLLTTDVDHRQQDRLGNTALMYAILCNAHVQVLNTIIDQSIKRCGMDILKLTNTMGHTAHSLARKNHNKHCLKLLNGNRLRMLRRMHNQLALIKHWAQLKSLNAHSDVVVEPEPLRRTCSTQTPIWLDIPKGPRSRSNSCC